ncbi:MAG: DUF4115 domain-containing protein [Alphaproteobacteria bacterium]|jgi:cytoskeleton protein RodZ|nr:DUF4115 domain-containing protein [Alphaproteobacteria bacterium]MDP6660470.1 DUF4115 domain-containing protein [Alphaproteobacteria bacterium]MDP6781521.1 DUF4115 domain-containing protein [Alphaproteobacteria bacterium]
MAGRKKLHFGIPKKEGSGGLFAGKDDPEPGNGKSAAKSKRSSDEAREDKKTPAEELRLSPEDVTDISAFLREERLRQKVELRDVATKLNIRLIHLQAIEDGRFADLPGATYALGFVRAYTEFLKLDQQAVMARFRSQMEGVGEEAELKFLVLEPETRVPSGAIILVSILLAAVAYGSWYRFSMEGREDMEIVTDVPERLTGSLWDEAQPPQEPLLEQEEKLAAEDAHDDRFSSEDEVGGNAGDDIAGESPAQDAGEDSTPPGAASGEAPSVVALEEGVVITYFDEFGREYVAEYGESPLAPIFADHVPAEDISGEASNFQFMEMEDSEEATLLSPREPVVFGQQYGDVRIVIHVTEGSWIQVRDVSGALLISQILHPGNSYRVPKQEGLTLMTGNAGALQFLVDGNLVPSIGPPGSVRRGVILDPDRLLAGTAVSQ